jgi:CHAD domain-containing protein
MANAPAPNSSTRLTGSLGQTGTTIEAETADGDLGTLLVSCLDERWKKYLRQLRRSQKRSSEKSVHDLRVATRRLVSLLDIVMTVASDDRLRKMRRVLKKRFDALSLLRDIQVQLLYVQEMLPVFPQLEAFRTVLMLREQRLTKLIDKQVRKTQTVLLGRILASTRKRIRMQFEAPAMDSAGLAAVTGAVGAAFARAVDLRRNVKPADTKTIHKLRVAFKKFRYMVEALQPILVGVTDTQFKAMNAYQVRMGNIQDVEVLSANVERHAMRRTRASREARRRGAAQRGLDASFVPVLQQLTSRRATLVEQFLGSADELFGFWKKPVTIPDESAEKSVPRATGAKSE